MDGKLIAISFNPHFFSRHFQSLGQITFARQK